MSDFLYYVPTDKVANKTKPTIDELRAYGLGHVFDTATSPRPVIGAGPDNMQGLLLFATEGAGRAKYAPDKQTWVEMQPGVWMGYWDDSPPTPDELQRFPEVPGEWILMPDGRNWLVPHARKYVEVESEEHPVGFCALPQRLKFSQGEWFRGGVQRQYADLWAHVEGYEQALANGMEQPNGMITFWYPHMAEMAVCGLSVNYRVGPHEVEALELLDESSRDKIIDVLRDLGTWRAWAKKKAEQALAGGDLLSGQESSTPGDDQTIDQQQPITTDGILATTGSDA